MELVLYKFSKMVNSTKRPEGETIGVTKQVTLKQPTNRENPTFIIDGIDLEYNYCKWADHYYFIDSITIITNDIYEIQCTEDVLATWKTYIGWSTQYVERASTSNEVISPGGIIPDNMYPTLPVVERSIYNMNAAPSWSNGLYVLSFIQHDNSSYFPNAIYRGGLVYAVLTPSQAQTVMKNIQDSAASGPDVNVMSFFPSLMYIPLNTSVEYSGTDYEYVISGAPNIIIPKNNIPASIVNTGIFTTWTDASGNRLSGSLRRHYQSTYGDYLDYKPFNQYILHGGPFGDIELPQELLTLNRTSSKYDFWMAISYDLCTGDAIMNILPNSTQDLSGVILRKECHIGVNISMSEISAIGASYAKQKYNLSKFSSVASSLVSGAKMAYNPIKSIGELTDTATSLQSAYYDYAYSTLPGAYTSGSNGSFVDFTIPCNILQVSRTIWMYRTDYKYGKPVNRDLQIDSIPGYIKCHSFSATMPCHLSEYQKIESYAITGFYFE